MGILRFLEKLISYSFAFLKYEYKRVFYLIFGQKSFQKFIIISRSRTGSTLLVDLLNSHPEIETHGEIFKNKRLWSSQGVWNRLYSHKSKKTKAVGCKLFYYHDMEGDKNVWSILDKNPDVKILHLQRKDLLKVVVSREIAHNHDSFASNQSVFKKNLSTKKKTIHLDPKAAIKQIETTERVRLEANMRYKEFEKLDVFYKDLSGDSKIFDQIFEFLGVSAHKVESKMKKQNPEKVSSLIENYDEVEKVFKASKWGYLLDN